MKMMYRILCFLFLLPVFMSADVHTDSLEIQLRSAEKSEKVSILNELAEYCISEFPEKSLEYSKQALLLLDKSDKGFAEIYNSIGAAYENLQDIDITIYYYNLALEFAIEEENIEEEASALYSLGLVYDGLDKYRKSLEYYLNASNIYYELGKEDTYANLLNNIGIIYESLNIYDKALEYYLNSYKRYEKINDKEGLANSLNNMGNIYQTMKYYDRALEYYNRSMGIYEEIDNESGISSSYNNIGIIYHELKDYDKTLEYYQLSLEIAYKIEEKEGIATSLNNIGIVYNDLKDYEKALENYLMSLETSIELNDNWAVANTSINIGEMYIDQRDFIKGLDYLEKGVIIAEEYNFKDLLMESFKIFSKYYLGKKDYKNTYFQFKKFAELKDSLFAESSQKIAEIQTIYETEKKEKEIELLLLEQKHNKSIKTFFIIASIFLFIIAELLLYLYYVKNKEIKRRRKIEEALKDSEEMFRKLTEYLKTAVYTFDLKGKFIYVNPATQEITGYSEDELLSMKFFELVHPDFKEIVEARGQTSAISEDVMDHYEYKIIRKDGLERWIDTSNSVINLQEKTIILGTALDITERKQTEGKIMSSLEEKEVMLKEIHHRVKNNMQVISSLLKLQSSHITDEKSLSLFKNSQNRVKSMALVHEKLYNSKDLAKIDFYDYVKKLTTHLMISYGVNTNLIKIIIDVKNVYFNINTAIPCGLIINEIISNSLKYAFPDGRKGKISLLIKKNKTENYIAIISDDGIGFPKDIDFKNTDSMGLQLVNSLTDQLHGTIEMENNKGTTYKIRFKGINQDNL